MSLTNILSILSFQSLFFAFLILMKKNKNQPDYWLSAFFILIFLQLQINVLTSFSTSYEYIDYGFLSMICITAWFPVLYLYFQTQTRRFRFFDLYHFIPVMLVAIVVFYNYTFRSLEHKLEIVESLYDQFPLWVDVWRIVTFLMIFPLYTFLSWKKISELERIRTDFFSYPEVIRVKWLKKIVAVMLSTILIALVFFMIENIFGIPLLRIVIYAFLVFAIAIFYLGVYGITNNVALVELENEYSIVPNGKEDSGTKKTILNDCELEIKFLDYKKLLIDCMDAKKPYLNPKLSLKGLASIADIPYYHLSTVINYHFDQNFYDFINQYRINEFIKNVENKENAKFTLLSIAFQSGFSSKSSFYSTFKRHKNLTPVQYLKRSGKSS